MKKINFFFVLSFSISSIHALEFRAPIARPDFKAELATIIRNDLHLRLLNNTVAQVAPNTIFAYPPHSLLTCAILYNSNNCAITLITMLNANVNKVSSPLISPLSCSLSQNNYHIANLLLTYGAKIDLNISTTPWDNRSLLSHIIYNLDIQDLARIQWLLENGANPHFTDSSGSSYLHYVSRRKWLPLQYLLSLTEHLLFFSVDINAQNSEHDTALHVAIRSGQHTKFIAYLLCKGAKKDSKAFELAKYNSDIHVMLTSDQLPPMPAEALTIIQERQKFKVKIA